MDSFLESAIATIRPMFAASPGSCGWLRIADSFNHLRDALSGTTPP